MNTSEILEKSGLSETELAEFIPIPNIEGEENDEENRQSV